MILDFLFVLCLLVMLYRGYRRGLLVAVFAVIALVAGTLGALKLSGIVATQLFNGGESGGRWVPLLSYILVFVLIVCVIRLGAKALERTLEAAAMGWANRLGGALLYGLMVCFVFSSLLWIGNRMMLTGPDTAAASLSYKLLEPVAPRVFSGIGMLLPFVKNMIAELNQFFDTVNQRFPADVGASR